MGQQEIRATKITGTELKSATGETLGTIQDLILNAASGRIDFAVASLQGRAGANTAAATGMASSATGQLVPIPWSLIRPAGLTGYGVRSTAGTSASEVQPTFIFTGDTTKLLAAPGFAQTSWPDFGQQSWRHSIYSYYGMSPGAGMGGAESPSGSSTGNEGSRYPTPPGTPRNP
jgi:sporulation protein YlmC with PRC-barrel domain